MIEAERNEEFELTRFEEFESMRTEECESTRIEEFEVKVGAEFGAENKSERCFFCSRLSGRRGDDAGVKWWDERSLNEFEFVDSTCGSPFVAVSTPRNFGFSCVSVNLTSEQSRVDKVRWWLWCLDGWERFLRCKFGCDDCGADEWENAIGQNLISFNLKNNRREPESDESTRGCFGWGFRCPLVPRDCAEWCR